MLRCWNYNEIFEKAERLQFENSRLKDEVRSLKRGLGVNPQEGHPLLNAPRPEKNKIKTLKKLDREISQKRNTLKQLQENIEKREAALKQQLEENMETLKAEKEDHKKNVENFQQLRLNPELLLPHHKRSIEKKLAQLGKYQKSLNKKRDELILYKNNLDFDAQNQREFEEKARNEINERLHTITLREGNLQTRIKTMNQYCDQRQKQHIDYFDRFEKLKTLERDFASKSKQLRKDQREFHEELSKFEEKQVAFEKSKELAEQSAAGEKSTPAKKSETEAAE